MLESIIAIHEKIVNEEWGKTQRYLFDDVNWNAPALCFFGARGVGKTTMLLQYYKEQYGSVEKCLYISADNINIISGGLFNLAMEYFSFGGNALIIDEVHKYSNWSVEVKNILDTFKSKQVIISGSSSLDLRRAKGDLSRRVRYYEVKGLSFREYLNFELGLNLKKYSLEDILRNHLKIAPKVKSNIAILQHFRNYLSHGHYPFFLESKGDYIHKLMNVIEKVLFEDVAVVFSLTQPKISVLKKILWLISTSHPFVPNISRMSKELNTSKEYVYNYLESLEMAGLIINLRNRTEGLKLVRKPGKIFLENTNLMHAITGSLHLEKNVGNIRETFFVNQLNNVTSIHLSTVGDFLVDEKYIFEIGGKNKGFSQIKGTENSYIAADGIEIGFGNKIPLWLFGFLY